MFRGETGEFDDHLPRAQFRKEDVAVDLQAGKNGVLVDAAH